MSSTLRNLLFSLVLVIGVAAQDAGQRERLQKMATDLNLTDAQKEQLLPILQEEGAKLKELRADTSLDRRSRAQKMREIQQSFQTKINPILDEEQRKKWEKMREEARDEMKKNRGKRNR